MALKIVDLSGKYPDIGRGPMSGVQGLIVHHTGLASSVQSVINGWNGSKGATGAQFVMDRDGTIYQVVPDGTKTNQIEPSWNPKIPWANNSTTQGIELLAKDDKDVTQAQTDALRQFALQQAAKYGYDPATHVVGHGEVNGTAGLNGKSRADGRQDTEGKAAVDALHDYLKTNGDPLSSPNVEAYGSPPIPRPDPRSSALTAISAATAPPMPVRPSGPMGNAGDAIAFGTPTQSGPSAFAKIISGGGNAPLVVQGVDGNTYSVSGDQNMKYNNPTAMKYDQFAIDHGAIGSSNRPGQMPLAVFPDLATGQAAAQQRLFGDNSQYKGAIPAYKDMTLGQAIKVWAPGGVDGNSDPTNYINGIAKSLGITPNTKLSDLTPAQQSQFITAQQHQEGNTPQVITDSQGNVVKGGSGSAFGAPLSGVGVPSLDSPNANYPLPTAGTMFNPASGTLMPFGSPENQALYNPNSEVDFGVQNRSGPPDERSNPLPQVVGRSTNAPGQVGSVPARPLAPSLTEAQRNAILAVPQGMPPPPRVDPRSIAPIPLTRPASITPPALSAPSLTPLQVAMSFGQHTAPPLAAVAPIPMPASARPVAPSMVAAPPSVAAPQPTVQINGHPYVVGQPVQDASGNTYVPQANGTMTKMPHISIGANTVMGGVVGQKIKEALPHVNAAVNGAVDNAKSAVSGAASAVGDKVGGFFGGLGSMFGNHGLTAPSSPPPPASNGLIWAQGGIDAAHPTMPSPPTSSYAPGQIGVNPSNTNSGAYSELLAQAADQRMLPPLPSTPTGYNTVTDAQRTAMSALPPAPHNNLIADIFTPKPYSGAPGTSVDWGGIGHAINGGIDSVANFLYSPRPSMAAPFVPPSSGNSGMSSPAGGYRNPPQTFTPPSPVSGAGSSAMNYGVASPLLSTGNGMSSPAGGFRNPASPYADPSNFGYVPPTQPTYKTIVNPAYTEWANGYTPTSGVDPYALSGAPSSATNYGVPKSVMTPAVAAPARGPAPAPTIRVQVAPAAPVNRPSTPYYPPAYVPPPPTPMATLASGNQAPVGQQFNAGSYRYQVNADGSTTNLMTGHTYGGSGGMQAPTMPNNSFATPAYPTPNNYGLPGYSVNPPAASPSFWTNLEHGVGNVWNGSTLGHAINFVTGNSGASNGGLLSMFGNHSAPSSGGAPSQGGGLLSGLLSGMGGNSSPGITNNPGSSPGAYSSSSAPSGSPAATMFSSNTLLPASMNNSRWLTGY
jgi:hypothetical protein